MSSVKSSITQEWAERTAKACAESETEDDAVAVVRGLDAQLHEFGGWRRVNATVSRASILALLDAAKGLSRAGKTDRYPRSVLKFRSVHVRDPNRSHPQQKPIDLFRYLVRTYSNPMELVVDPYSGSGVTGHACLAEGRRYRCWDSDERFGT